MSVNQFEPRERTFDEFFGEVVHLHLRRRGIHQKVLGAYMGLTQASVSNKVRGDRPWYLSDMTKVAEFLGEKLSDLVAEAERARRDSNPKPSDLVSTEVGWHPATGYLYVCMYCGDVVRGEDDWHECARDAHDVVVDLGAYRSRRSA